MSKGFVKNIGLEIAEFVHIASLNDMGRWIIHRRR
jgi:hypothetical protein